MRLLLSVKISSASNQFAKWTDGNFTFHPCKRGYWWVHGLRRKSKKQLAPLFLTSCDYGSKSLMVWENVQLHLDEDGDGACSPGSVYILHMHPYDCCSSSDRWYSPARDTSLLKGNKTLIKYIVFSPLCSCEIQVPVSRLAGHETIHNHWSAVMEAEID